MQVTFLGYSDLDFETKEGQHIDGIKVFWYFISDTRNYTGYEVGSYFIPRSRSDLINQVRSLQPLSECLLDMGFNGKRAVFNGITAI